MSTNDRLATTRAVVNDYFNCRINNTSNVTNQLFLNVRRLASDCERNYQLQQPKFHFRATSSSLTDVRTFHLEIALELFNDGIVSWGRIITLIVFSALMADRLIQHGLDAQLTKTSMIDWTTDFINVNLRTWLEAQNYWDGFMTMCQKNSQKRISVTRYASLLGTVGMITLGALYMNKYAY
ncbi:unnamed protein product [Adineta ricciae]|uniref:Bcl-2 Bcl-2 homology region 1-3 domain-containing protein n=1 Tax=Adineta ricciae TaxID=249248 RepID=A0A814U8J3_ADIRI|nr:unnamed protein product [Adineta ricciae]CAF1172436.1 unnamed protein product [Adineta ricciae]